MKLNIGVLFGGNSVEHEVSVISASQAIAAIDRERYHVIPLYLTKDHRLFTGEALLDVKNFKNMSSLLNKCKQVSIVKIQQSFHQSVVNDEYKWAEGLTLMPVGSVFELYIPSDLAYGDRPIGEIPAGSTLIFKVELLEKAFV